MATAELIITWRSSIEVEVPDGITMGEVASASELWAEEAYPDDAEMVDWECTSVTDEL